MPNLQQDVPICCSAWKTSKIPRSKVFHLQRMSGNIWEKVALWSAYLREAWTQSGWFQVSWVQQGVLSEKSAAGSHSITAQERKQIQVFYLQLELQQETQLDDTSQLLASKWKVSLLSCLHGDIQWHQELWESWLSWSWDQEQGNHLSSAWCTSQVIFFNIFSHSN